jgi:putative membrane protein
MRIIRRKSSDPLKGMIAGAAGGLVASWVMNQFQALLSRMTHGVERPHGAQSLQPGSPRHGVARELQERGLDREADTAAVRTAVVVSDRLFGLELAEGEKREIAGAVIHYAFGVATGGLYGAIAELKPATTTGAGLPFGAAVWLIADEIIVPALGLSKPPTKYPLSTHAYSIASHLVYGVTTEIVRREVRRALD